MNENRENKPLSWEMVIEELAGTKKLASEIVADAWKVSKAKDFAIGCLVAGIVTIGIGMAVINYKNDCDWRALFASYDYVSQDGEGYNYYNSDIGGNVVNGPENSQTEKQKESSWN